MQAHSLLLRTRLPLMPALALPLQGCSGRGAPSYAIFGAYFPLWLLSGLIGAAAALIAHRLFVAMGWSSWLPFQLSVCVAIGVAVAVTVWLSGSGHLI
jgi:Flp pilus assembly protein protease CpaA